MNPSFWIVSIREPLFYGRLYEKLLLSEHSEKIQGVITLPMPCDRGFISLLNEIRYRYTFWGPKASCILFWRYLVSFITLQGHFYRLAKKLGIAVYQAKTLEQVATILKAQNAEIVLASIPFQVNPHALQSTSIGWVNMHLGPLPRFAGMDAPFWCAYYEEKEFAMTLHWMDTEIDTGKIISQKTITNAGQSYFSAVEKLFLLGFESFCDLMKDPSTAIERASTQNSTERSFFKKPAAWRGREFRKKGGRFF